MQRVQRQVRLSEGVRTASEAEAERHAAAETEAEQAAQTNWEAVPTIAWQASQTEGHARQCGAPPERAALCGQVAGLARIRRRSQGCAHCLNTAA